MYQPGAIVLQCGADSLSGDRLGCFNLSRHSMLKVAVTSPHSVLKVARAAGSTMRTPL